MHIFLKKNPHRTPFARRLGTPSSPEGSDPPDYFGEPLCTSEGLPSVPRRDAPEAPEAPAAASAE